MRFLVLAVALLSPVAAFGQESASYVIGETALNLGGSPQAAADPVSASYRITLSSLGGFSVVPSLGATNYLLDGSIVGVLRPPGEVTNLRFDDKTTLVWDGERSIGTYTAYRSDLSLLGGTVACLVDGLTAATTSDSSPVAAGSGFFYLVAASNRVGEEGVLGESSSGAPRTGGRCP